MLVKLHFLVAIFKMHVKMHFRFCGQIEKKVKNYLIKTLLYLKAVNKNKCQNKNIYPSEQRSIVNDERIKSFE